jgi:hypothetical protein
VRVLDHMVPIWKDARGRDVFVTWSTRGYVLSGDAARRRARRYALWRWVPLLSVTVVLIEAGLGVWQIVALIVPFAFVGFWVADRVFFGGYEVARVSATESRTVLMLRPWPSRRQSTFFLVASALFVAGGFWTGTTSGVVFFGLCALVFLVQLVHGPHRA